MKNKYRIHFQKAYPPYHPKDTWDVEYKLNCALSGYRIVASYGTREEAEKECKRLNDNLKQRC